MNQFIIAQLFMGVLSMSLTAALIGLAVTAIRPFTEKYFSKKWNYYIWLLVVIRLAVPLHFEADFLHMLNLRANIGQTQPAASAETIKDIPGDTAATASVEIVPGTSKEPDADAYSRTRSGTSKKPDADAPVTNSAKQDDGKNNNTVFSVAGFLTAAAYLWLLGAIAALFIKLWGYHRFQSAIRKERVRITDYRILSMESAFCTKLGIHGLPVIYGSAHVSGPLTVGLRNPVIVFPLRMILGHSGETENSRQNLTQLQLMLHHELIHVARKDLLYKWAYQILLCLHWFNPLLRRFGRQMNRDCELSCDEAVLVHLTESGRQMYGNILLDTAAHSIGSNSNAFSTTLLENKKDLKKRLDSIRNHTKMTRFQLVFSICTLMPMLLLSACSSIRITMNGRNTPEEQQVNDVSDENDSNDDNSDDRSLFSEVLSSFVSSDTFLSNFPEAHKYGDAWNVYDDDTLTAGRDVCDNWGAYNYCGGQKLTASGMALYGSSTVLIAYADKDIEADVTSSFEIVKGKFKIVSIAPDGTVTTINNTGTESRQTITMKEGRNVIKLVGQGAKLKKLALSYSDLNTLDFNKVYFSEDEEYAEQICSTIKAGEPIEKDKVMDILHMISDPEEVSDIFHTLLISRVPFTSRELSYFFIYSDADLSGKYLVEAIEDGYQKPLDVESVSAVVHYIDNQYIARLLMQLPPESFFDALKDSVYYLDSEQIEECLTDYIQGGGTLSYADFSVISRYMDDSAVDRLSAMLGGQSF